MRLATADKLLNALRIFLWKCSRTEIIPNGSLKKGVINLVTLVDPGSRNISQNLKFVSHFKNIITSSEYSFLFESGSLSLIKLSLTFDKATNRLFPPFFFATTTKGEHHSVVSVMGAKI